jgi:hypothetical protein
MKKLILSLLCSSICISIYAQLPQNNFKNLTIEQLTKMQLDERKKMPGSEEYNNLLAQKDKIISQITAQMSTQLEKTKNEIKQAWDAVKSQVQSKINDQQIKNLKSTAKSKTGNSIAKLEEKLRTQQNDLAKLIADATQQINARLVEFGKKIRLYEQENATLRAINEAIRNKR